MDSGTSLSSVEADDAHAFKPRRSVRLDVEGETELTPHKLYKIEVVVRNVSALGFMAECSEPVRIGSFVSLDVPGIGPVDAQVRWQIGVRMGGLFVDPISLARCDWTATAAD